MFNQILSNRGKSKANRQGDVRTVINARMLAGKIGELSDDSLRYHAMKLATYDGLPSPSNSNATRRTWKSVVQEEHAMAFAIEAVRRTMGINLYNVQLQAALSISRGEIAEMQTGEGKTLTGVVAAIIHALQSRHVHIATTNEYLARRDYETLSPVLNALGLNVGLSVSDQNTEQTQAAYRADVVFATGYQLGFDYLRDQLTLAARPRVQLGGRLRDQLRGINAGDSGICQRGHDVVIIDEVDSVLVDEAMTPLVLSGASDDARTDHAACDLAFQCSQSLASEVDYELNSTSKVPQLTRQGIQNAEAFWRDSGRNAVLEFPWLRYVQSALHAKYALTRNVDYVVRDDAVEIVDASTGRIVPDRQWRGGLHQAVQTKEQVTRTPPRHTMARLSRQRYFARYETLSGMTGTAGRNDHEWKTVYRLAVTPIPTRLPSRRIESSTVYVADQAQKLAAIVEEAQRFLAQEQPVLIGTRTIEQTRLVSKALLAARVNHRLLNGIQDEAEAELIGIAGRSGSCTVATNMAGRGTDIVLDESAIAAGGLHVIGFERNHSARIDRQLLGRAARQGQPGSGRFFVSSEDQVVADYAPRLAKMISKLKEPISNPAWDRRVESAQTSIERERYESRQQTALQEEWLNGLRQHVA